ncbi:class I SAM-dependent methyltransferase [Chlorobium sp. N1]|uniref:class I SAM-dependent methyltransferase n=1 Tax=Chlorobium sp. N1 TaxID=2491138 RepID=UPI0010409785|nr:class I SAM-dependent methyltransferase [Chlorobium sp. N1]TCD47305.1 class I SAM-dependent methyltransferase [Chlorobium sp. N1]
MAGSEPPFISVPDRFNPAEGDRWRIVRDPVKGTLKLDPRPEPEEMAGHYRHAAYSPHLQKARTPGERLYLAASSLLLERRASLVAKVLTGKENPRILEIGCARGTLLDRLARRRVADRRNLVGIEPDAESAACARERYGVTIHPSVELLRGGTGTFDAVVLWHALEHLHDLEGSLETVSALLTPGGRLVIALPNPSGRDARHYGADWVAWDAPRHLWHFPPGTLERMLEPFGFRRSAIRQWTSDALFNALLSEKLRCRRRGRKMHGGKTALALTKGILFALAGAIDVCEASGIVRVFSREGEKTPA